MLRAIFIVGALAVLGAIVVARGLLWLSQRTGIDFYASSFAWVVLLVWIVAMIGGITYGIARYFAKPSY